MALEYDLDLATRMAPTQALEELASKIPGLGWGEDRSFLFDESVQITAAESLAITQSIIRDGFHFTPTLGVGFRHINNSDWDRFKDTTLQAVALLLEHSQDAVLLFNGETIVFQRLEGKLTFNSGYRLWEDDNGLRSRLAIPFERRPLPSPLL
ncbi:SitI3 family protein [Cystobacter fuscus]|uniref:SitI3 family protein n=1 Tax=Cystobacter fuscus TaxID=43 RepID=UPI002B2D3E38|nr:hypothetical protein F0U63_02265 [Cystobacter fuscus]